MLTAKPYVRVCCGAACAVCDEDAVGLSVGEAALQVQTPSLPSLCRYSNMACEVLTLDAPAIVEYLCTEVTGGCILSYAQAVMVRIWDMLDVRGQLNPIVARCV